MTFPQSSISYKIPFFHSFRNIPLWHRPSWLGHFLPCAPLHFRFTSFCGLPPPQGSCRLGAPLILSSALLAVGLSRINMGAAQAHRGPSESDPYCTHPTGWGPFVPLINPFGPCQFWEPKNPNILVLQSTHCTASKSWRLVNSKTLWRHNNIATGQLRGGL